MNYTLLTIGKTHTGKSTFANELLKEIQNGVILETDLIALFLRANYPKLHALDVDHKGSFSSPSLKFLLFRTVLSFALEQNVNIIMSNSNMYQNGRKDVLSIIKQYSTKSIGLYFNYPEEIILERVKVSKRDTSVLSVSKDFEELVVNQRTRFQPPNETDFDYFFEVKNVTELLAIKDTILKLYNS